MPSLAPSVTKVVCAPISKKERKKEEAKYVIPVNGRWPSAHIFWSISCITAPTFCLSFYM